MVWLYWSTERWESSLIWWKHFRVWPSSTSGPFTGLGLADWKHSGNPQWSSVVRALTWNLLLLRAAVIHSPLAKCSLVDVVLKLCFDLSQGQQCGLKRSQTEPKDSEKVKMSLPHIGTEHIFGKTSACFKIQMLHSIVFSEWVGVVLEARPGLHTCCSCPLSCFGLWTRTIPASAKVLHHRHSLCSWSWLGLFFTWPYSRCGVSWSLCRLEASRYSLDLNIVFLKCNIINGNVSSEHTQLQVWTITDLHCYTFFHLR